MCNKIRQTCVSEVLAGAHIYIYKYIYIYPVWVYQRATHKTTFRSRTKNSANKRLQSHTEQAFRLADNQGCRHGEFFRHQMGVSENRDVSPKMDGENNGIVPIKMDDLGGFHPLFSGNIQIEGSIWYKGCPMLPKKNPIIML